MHFPLAICDIPSGKWADAVLRAASLMWQGLECTGWVSISRREGVKEFRARYIAREAWALCERRLGRKIGPNERRSRAYGRGIPLWKEERRAKGPKTVREEHNDSSDVGEKIPLSKTEAYIDRGPAPNCRSSNSDQDPERVKGSRLGQTEALEAYDQAWLELYRKKQPWWLRHLGHFTRLAWGAELRTVQITMAEAKKTIRSWLRIHEKRFRGDLPSDFNPQWAIRGWLKRREALSRTDSGPRYWSSQKKAL